MRFHVILIRVFNKKARIPHFFVHDLNKGIYAMQKGLPIRFWLIFTQ